jgi:hypothetical protein
MPQRTDPGGAGQFFVPKDTSDQMVVDVTAQIVMRDYADQLHLKSELIKDIYANETEAIIAKAPEMFIHAGTELLDANLTHTLGESLHWLSTQYGDDYVSPWLQTYMVTDSQSAAKTRALIEQIAMEDVGPATIGAGGVTSRAYASDALQRILAGEIDFNDLPANEQLAVQNLAVTIRSQGEQVAATGTDNISKALWIHSSGDYGMALTTDETQAIDEIIKLGTFLGPGKTNDLTREVQDQLGIDQIQAIDDGVLVLDEEWAVENPDELAAIGAYLEQRYPDVRIKVGRQGIVGSALDLIGEPADLVGSYIGAGLNQVSEFVERIGGDHNEELRQRAAYLRKKMELGAVPEDQVEDTLHEIGRLEEDATNELGFQSLSADFEEARSNATTGGGFGELTTQAMGIMPGDTGYNLAVTGWTLFGQIAFDPTTYIIPVARGLSAARRLPLLSVENIPEVSDLAKVFRETPEIVKSMGLEGETLAKIESVTESVAKVQVEHLEKLAASGIPDAVHGVLARRVYKTLAKTPDAWFGTKPYRNYVETFTSLRNAVGEERFATILGRSGFDPPSAVNLAKGKDVNDMHLALGSGLLPAPNSPPVVAINAEINELDDALKAGRVKMLDPSTNPYEAAAFRNVETDLVARKVYLESLKTPGDVRVHGVGLPPKRVLNQIVKLGKADQVYAMDHVANALIDTKPGWRSRLFFSLDHLYKQAGTSREITLTGVNQLESIEYMNQFARYLRLPEGRINELFQPWLTGKLTSDTARWRWFDNTFKSLIDESPTLGAAGKQELRQWYNSYEGTRIADYINVAGARPMPTLPINVPGRALSGRPAWSSSELHGFSMRLPSARSMRSYQTMIGRTLNRMDNVKGAKLISGTMHGIGSTWYAFNDVWRTFVLATRPVSLVGRVSLEQQIRIAAYGYSSMFNHPLQYFRSLGPISKMHASEFSLFTDTSEYALGSLIDDYVKRHGDLVNAGAVVKYGPSGPDKHLFDAIAEQLTHIGKSPEFNRYFVKGLTDSNEWGSWDVNTALGAFNDPDNAKVAAHWRNVYENEVDVADVSEGLSRTWQEVTELLGDADDDVRKWLQAMLVRGESKLDGVNYKLGTQEFAEKLKELDGSLVAGVPVRWRTAVQEVPLNSSLYASAEKSNLAQRAANSVLRTTFTKPDLAASRSPMFRQVASREYNSLIGYGYSVENAHRIASERAAGIVADHMFELGMHTPGEVFWRNLNPFFPAWRELFSTWLIRIPQKLGGAENAGLAWSIGMTALTRRVSAGISALMAGGFMERNPDGELVFNVGDSEIPVQSIAGIFPLPLNLGDTSKTWPERLQGVAPSLGAPATFTLGALQNAVGDTEMGELLENVEHWVAPYGTDTSLGPTAIDALYEATGNVAPWMSSTTQEMHKTMIISAKIDGMRLWIEDHPAPKPPPEITTAEERNQWMKNVLAPWYANQIAAGERYARSIYLRKGLMGMLVPFRVDSVNEGKRETEQMWSDMNVIRDLDIPGLSGQIISDFMDEHPELQSYLTGKYLDERSNISSHEDIGTFFEAVANGDINIRTVVDWMVFNYGKSTINVMQRRISAEEQRLRDPGREGFADYLLDPHAEDELNRVQRSLENFRIWTGTKESMVEGQSATFESMLTQYDKFKAERYGSEPSVLDLREEKLLDTSSALAEFDSLIKADPDGSDKWYESLDKVYEKLGENPNADWFDRAQSYFFTNVTGKFYKQQRRIYDQIDVTDKGQQGPLFDQLRELAAKYNDPRAHNGVIFPTPEEYQFSRWNPREQRSKVADWAALNPMYLTEFQREQVGYTIAPEDQEKANKLATFSSKVYDRIDNYADQYGREPTEDEMQKGANVINKFGSELGLDAYLDEVNRPAYKRVTDALNLNERSPAWKSLVTAADAINKYVEDSDYGDKKWNREYYFDWFVKQVDHAASNDKVLSEVLSEVQDGLEGAVGNQAGGDFLRYLFFGWYPSRNDDFREADLTS